MSLMDAAQSIRSAIQAASRGLVDREHLAELIVLGAVAGEHLLVVGPPGTGKSLVVRRMAQTLGGNYYEYLLGRFTEPNEIFGPVDLRKLREGRVETETRGMLPEADIAFLDEIFLGSTAILNTLLGLLNERVFVRGHTRVVCPLRICIGASNRLPEDESLGAFADRFLLHLFVDPLGDNRLEELLEGGWAAASGPLEQIADIAALDVLTRAKDRVDMVHVRPQLAHAFRLLRKAGILLTDRRMVRIQSLVASAAVMGGREQAIDADLWPLIFAIPTKEGQELAGDVLHDLLATSQNKTLPTAAEGASQGALARAQRIVQQGQWLLDEPDEAREAWLLKLEGIVREIDASFSVDQQPRDLKLLYARILEVLPDYGTAKDKD